MVGVEKQDTINNWQNCIYAVGYQRHHVIVTPQVQGPLCYLYCFNYYVLFLLYIGNLLRDGYIPGNARS